VLIFDLIVGDLPRNYLVEIVKSSNLEGKGEAVEFASYITNVPIQYSKRISEAQRLLKTLKSHMLGRES
tara:strand:+ start:81 stop:287 length:207 start_codon:yes stop_codon:yes gene_type:complete